MPATSPRSGCDAPPRRAGRLVAWGNAVLASRCSPDEAARRVVGSDLRHEVVGLPSVDEQTTLTVLLARLRGLGVTSLRLVLPVPGDASGLPGPATFNTEALAAGEVVLAVGAPLGLLPAVELRTVRWLVSPVERDAERVAAPTLSEARRRLLEELAAVTEALVELDVARWRPELAEALVELRCGAEDTALAPGYPSRAVEVASMARRLATVVRLAAGDDGAAVSAGEMGLRAGLLGDLAAACRAAECAAHNEVPPPAGRPPSTSPDARRGSPYRDTAR